MEGFKHVLGIWVEATEAAKLWARVCAVPNPDIGDVLRRPLSRHSALRFLIRDEHASRRGTRRSNESRSSQLLPPSTTAAPRAR